ncbi:MAG: glycosyltransferase family 4 protein [Sphingobacteriaceae bacterium]|nr:glycosyltransferase family 4 protein [Sphingobacteriaceae bacterium]
MKKFVVLVQGPSSFRNEVRKAWGETPIIWSTWEGNEDLHQDSDEVLFNKLPSDTGVHNLGLQQTSVYNGLVKAKQLGYTHVLKWRSDMIPTDYRGFISTLEEDKICLLCQHKGRNGYYTDYFMYAPIDIMLNIWSFSNYFVAFPEKILTHKIRMQPIGVKLLLNSLSSDNDIYWIKNKLYMVDNYKKEQVYTSDAIPQHPRLRLLMLSQDNHQKGLLIGGKHVHQMLLMRELKDLEVDVTFIAPHRNLLYWVVFKILAVLRRTRMVSFVNYTKFFYKALNILLTNALNRIGKEYDVVSCQDAAIHAIMLSYVKKHKLPVMVTLHGYLGREFLDASHFPEREKTKIYEYLLELEKSSAKEANKIFTVDTRIKNYVVDSFAIDSSRLSVVFNAVDERRFFPVDTDIQSAIREKLNVPKDAFVVLVARRFVRKNGVLYALKALNMIANPNVFLFIVGDGQEKDALFSEYESYDELIKNRIRFVGAVDYNEIDLWYKACDVLLMPSVKSEGVEEATSLSMLEGMICGKVVIGFAVGGIKEVIEDAVTGYLLEDRDYTGMANAITLVAENKDLYNKISENAYKYAYEQHASKRHAERFLSLLQETITN